MLFKYKKLSYLAIMVWVSLSTMFYINKVVLVDWFIVLPAFIAPGFLIILALKYFCIEKFVFNQECKNTHYKLGWLSILLIANIIQAIMIGTFNRQTYLLNQFYWVSLYLMNPIVIYYFFYHWLLDIFKKKTPH